MSEIKRSVDLGILNSGRLNRLTVQMEEQLSAQSSARKEDKSPLMTNQHSSLSLY
jgi:hypothetical protein